MFDNLIRVNLNELHKLDAAYANKDEFTEADMKKFDMLTCTLSRLMKSLPYIEEFGYDQDQSISGRRGHWPVQPPPPVSGGYYGRAYGEAVPEWYGGRYPMR